MPTKRAESIDLHSSSHHKWSSYATRGIYNPFFFGCDLATRSAQMATLYQQAKPKLSTDGNRVYEIIGTEDSAYNDAIEKMADYFKGTFLLDEKDIL